MTRLLLRGLAARRLRTALTGLAVVLGVALVSGTFILTDTIDRSFDRLFTAVNARLDVKVVPAEPVGSTDGFPPPFDARLLQRVRDVPEVAAASGTLQAPVAFFGPDGRRLGAGGTPSFAFGAQGGGFDPFTYEGRPPRAPAEVAIDRATASRHGFAIGDRVRIAGPGGRAASYRIVGLGTLAGASTGGTSIAVLTLPTVQELAGDPGKLSEIDVRGRPGTSDRALAAAVRAALPPGAVEVRTATQDTRANQADIGEGLGFLTTALLVFAGVALLVGGFSIYNTLSITVAQRTRELALLRTIGASRRQVLRSVLAESAVVGLLASLVGLVAGVGLVPLLNLAFEAIGADLPAQGTVVLARTVIAALLVGTLITVLAGLAPALRATRVAPVLALREGAVLPPGRRARWRPAVAVALVALGLGVLCVGLFAGVDGASRVASLLGLGAVLMVFGVALLSPLLVPPLAAALGRPVERVGGVAGRLARGNAVRNPGRTAGTAAALMIGVALVAFVSIFAAGLKGSIAQAFDQAFAGDLVVQDASFGPVPLGAARAVGETPGVAAVSPLRFSAGRVRGVPGTTSFGGVDPATVGRVVDLRWREGSDAAVRTLAAGGAVADADWARDHGLRVGDRVSALTPTGRRAAFTLRGTYENRFDLFADVTVANATLARAFGAGNDAVLLVDTAGRPVSAVRADVARMLDARYPTLTAQSNQQFKEQQQRQVDGLVNLIYALLALAVIISVFGIVTTLALSIHERTRELGVLRAVGASRRQIRRMVRGEAVITALIGALLGVVLGVAFAVVVSRPLASQGFVLSFPVPTLLVLLALSALAGVLAAVGPARRASRVDVLRALAYE
jgi:putative ABC transport system permease protein